MSAAQQYCPTQASGPNVTTWHNDINRTGWQCNEASLTAAPGNAGSVNQSNFGLLFQWPVAGRVYAQPLTVTVNQNVGTGKNVCQKPCSLVLVATEEDMLYAFNASPSQFSQTPVWSLNLAAQVPPPPTTTGTYVDCAKNPAYFYACVGTDPDTGEPNSFSTTNIGVTGTPVIDMSMTVWPKPILYVIGAVCFNYCQTYYSASGYYLFAVDITTGAVVGTPPEISATVSGQSPTTDCSLYQGTGSLQFSSMNVPNAHLQRSGLLLLNVGGTNNVYVAFADLPEHYNGWLFGYQPQNNGGNYSLSQTAAWATTPYGTGGGIWGSGAGPASDGTYIYLATGNGTIIDATSGFSQDLTQAGNSLLKLLPPTAPSTTPTIYDFYTPYDVFNFDGSTRNVGNCTGLCPCDEDLSSGGVLLPPVFTYNSAGVIINADKQSNIYVANQQNLGQYGGPSTGSDPNACPTTPNNLECVQTPTLPSNDLAQGYWSSPAYWYDGTYYWLYYAATLNGMAYGTQYQGGYGPVQVLPEALNAYQLQRTGTVGPVSQTPYANSGNQSGNQNSNYPILFCDHAPTPSLSSNPDTPAGSGIVWAVEENQNNDNTPKQSQGSCYQDCAPTQTNGCGGHPAGIGNSAALHALCAAAGGSACPLAMTELYNSRNLQTQIGPVGAFPTPTVFNGQVYVGTNTFVNVFGICNTNVGNGGQCLK